MKSKSNNIEILTMRFPGGDDSGNGGSGGSGGGTGTGGDGGDGGGKL